MSNEKPTYQALEAIIVEQKKRLQAKKSGRDYLDNIINNIADPLFVKDDNSRMVLVNDAFSRLLGIPKNRIIGKTMTEDLPAEQMEGFLKRDKQVKLQISMQQMKLTDFPRKIVTLPIFDSLQQSS